MSKKTVTSASRPITLSWMIQCESGGKLGLCFCPGKVVPKHGIRRNMLQDLMRLRDFYGVTTIICLLDMYELRSYQITKYEDQVQSAGLIFGPHFPIVEMAAPKSIPDTHSLIASLGDRIEQGECLAVHCRGGVGRAGLIACCVMLHLGICKTAASSIFEARRLRCKTAVESRNQEDFIAKYKAYIGTLPTHQPKHPMSLYTETSSCASEVSTLQR